MGEYTCGTEGMPGSNHFQANCKGCTVINKGVGGTTAYQWRVGGDQETNNAFADAGSGITHVWLSVGGNDFQSPAEGGGGPGSDSAVCKMSTSNLGSRIQAAIDGVNTAATDNGITGHKIILTGYCIPTASTMTSTGCTNDDMKTLSTTYTKMAADNSNVEFHDISMQCEQKGKYFITDGLHLNKKGYCQAFSKADVQTAFGCETAAHDCTTVTSTACDGVDSTASGEGGDDGSSEKNSKVSIVVTVALAVVAMVGLAL